MTPFENVCSRLHIVRRSGSTATAHCPGPRHSRGDRNPSLAVTEAADGKVLLKCHAGCTAKEIVARIGLGMRDLFPANGRPSRDYGIECVAVRVGGRSVGAEAGDGDETAARAAALRADQEDEPGADDEAGRPYSQDAGPDPWDEDAAAASQTSHDGAQRARLPQDQRTTATAAGSPPGWEIAPAGRQGAPAAGHPAPAAPGAREPVTVALLAERFGLDVAQLRSLGPRDAGGVVLVPYRGEDGEELFAKRRVALAGPGKYRMPKSTHLTLYGLDRLPDIRRTKRPTVILTESETDAWCLWAHGFPALAVPGASATRVIMAEHVRSIRYVYVCKHADEAGAKFVSAAADRLRMVGYDGERPQVVEMPPGVKDVGELHADDPERFEARFRELCKAARPLTGGATESCWARAVSAPDLLAAGEGADEVDFLEPRQLARGCLTLWFSPRGLGKTHVAHAIAVKLASAERRVLLLDRDNSRAEVMRRLRGWGGADAARLKILTREDAPPLMDLAKWRDYPHGEYDALIVDSLDATAEGVGEQDSAKPSKALATLLDIARREDGPAILVLGNTIKSGAHGRGSGIVEDRGDIVYEVRDATDLRPSGFKPWVDELPPADAGSWAPRAARRQRRDTYCLAFVSTKFRIGEEPEPFILEVNLSTEPWTLGDVTDEVDRAGAEARQVREREEHERREMAVAALAREVDARAAAGTPLVKSEAEELLRGHRLTRKAARELIDSGVAWRLGTLEGHRGKPMALLPVRGDVRSTNDGGENQGGLQSPNPRAFSGGPISAAQAGRARRKSVLSKPLENQGPESPPIPAADDVDALADLLGEV
jgi:hypothetical protein